MNYLLIINLMASALLLAKSACELNEMDHTSQYHARRTFFSVLATGSVAVLLGAFWGYQNPRPEEVILNVGAAGAIAGDWAIQRILSWRQTPDPKDPKNGQPKSLS